MVVTSHSWTPVHACIVVGMPTDEELAAMSTEERDIILADLEQDSIRREREECDAELAKEYGELQ